MAWHGMGWDVLGWDGLGWDGMELDRTGWHGMGWDGMGWNGVGWDGMDRMGWDGRDGMDGAKLPAHFCGILGFKKQQCAYAWPFWGSVLCGSPSEGRICAFHTHGFAGRPGRESPGMEKGAVSQDAAIVCL